VRTSDDNPTGFPFFLALDDEARRFDDEAAAIANPQEAGSGAHC
jgi:hypothetical protein